MGNSPNGGEVPYDISLGEMIQTQDRCCVIPPVSGPWSGRLRGDKGGRGVGAGNRGGRFRWKVSVLEEDGAGWRCDAELHA